MGSILLNSSSHPMTPTHTFAIVLFVFQSPLCGHRECWNYSCSYFGHQIHPKDSAPLYVWGCPEARKKMSFSWNRCTTAALHFRKSETKTKLLASSPFWSLWFTTNGLWMLVQCSCGKAVHHLMVQMNNFKTAVVTQWNVFYWKQLITKIFHKFISIFLSHHEYGSRKDLWNGILPPHFMAPQPKRPWLELHHHKNLKFHVSLFKFPSCTDQQ